VIVPGLIPRETRAVFFDAVGTLLHPVPGALSVYADFARRHGLDTTPAAIRARFLEAYRAEESADAASGWVTSEEREQHRWRRIVTESLAGVRDADACFRELYEHFARPDAWRVDPAAGELVARLLDRGFAVGLGSNYDARLWPVLDGFPELSPLRGRVVVSAAVGFRKPAAEFFREVVRVAGCEPGGVLFVGDDLGNDYEGAAAAGLGAILLDPADRYPTIPRRIRNLVDLMG
jgi:putative hydrolase of the HAD superfamily